VVCYDHVRVVTGIEMMIAKKKKKNVLSVRQQTLVVKSEVDESTADLYKSVKTKRALESQSRGMHLPICSIASC
jgi:phosphosulfolactate synthase (CoM biosynthesis protein A)